MAQPAEIPPPGASLSKQQPVQPDKHHHVEIQVPPSPSDVVKSNTAVCVINESVRTVIVPSAKVVDLSLATTNCTGPLQRTEPCMRTTTPSAGLPSMPVEVRHMDNAGLIGKPLSYGGQNDAMDSTRAILRLEDSPTPILASSNGSVPLHRADKCTFITPRTTASSAALMPMDPRQMDSPGIIGKPPVYGGQPENMDGFRVLGHGESPSPTNHYASPTSHQQIDWRNYKTYKEYIDNRRMHMYGCRTIQERLDSLRAASQNQTDYNQLLPNRSSVQVRRRSTSHDRVPHPAQIKQRSISQERLEDPALVKDWPRSASQDAIPLPAMLPRSPKSKSWDVIARKGGRLDLYTADLPEYNGERMHNYQWTGFTEQDDRRGIYEQSRQHSFHMSLRSPNFQMGPVAYSPDIRQMSSRVLASAHPLQRAPTDIKNTPVSRDFHSSSFRSHQSRPIQSERCGISKANSVRGSSNYGPKPYASKKVDDGIVKDQKMVNHINKSGVKKQQIMSPVDGSPSSHIDPVIRSPLTTSTPIPTKPVKQVTAGSATSNKVEVHNGQSSKANDHDLSMEFDSVDPVVLRDKSPSGRQTPQPIRQQSYIFALNDQEPVTDTTCWLPNDARREVHIKRMEQKKASSSSSPGDSLASIPFIGKPYIFGDIHIPVPIWCFFCLLLLTYLLFVPLESPFTASIVSIIGFLPFESVSLP